MPTPPCYWCQSGAAHEPGKPTGATELDREICNAAHDVIAAQHAPDADPLELYQAGERLNALMQKRAIASGWLESAFAIEEPN